MMQRFRILSLVAITATLAACGGGSGSEDAVDKYVGTWTKCLNLGSNEYSKIISTISKTGANSGLNSNTPENIYSNSTCTIFKRAFSAPIPSTFNIVGTKTIGGNVVDKIDIVYQGSLDTIHKGDTAKGVLFTSGTLIYFGQAGSNDAEGYPTALSQPYTKQ